MFLPIQIVIIIYPIGHSFFSVNNSQLFFCMNDLRIHAPEKRIGKIRLPQIQRHIKTKFCLSSATLYFWDLRSPPLQSEILELKILVLYSIRAVCPPEGNQKSYIIVPSNHFYRVPKANRQKRLHSSYRISQIN